MTHLARPLLILLVLLLATVFSTQALAAKKGGEKAPPLYPETSREDRSPTLQNRYSKKLALLAKQNEKEDFVAMLATSLEIANDPKAKPSDKAIGFQNAAFAAIETDDLDTALIHIQAALETDALSNDTHFQLMLQVAQINLGEERYEEGLRALDAFMSATNSRKPEHLALRGNALYRLERSEEATAVLEEAIKASEKPQDSWRQLLMAAYVDLDRTDEAARVAQDIAAANPDDKRGLANLAAIYAQGDQLDKAAGVLEDMRARGLFTEDRDYRQLYSMYLNLDGKETQAIEVINEGLAKGVLQETSEVYTHLAQANYFSDQFDAAILAYQKAVPLAKDGEPSLNLARVLSNEERYAESRSAAKDALARGVRKSGDAWIIIARAEFGLKNDAAMIAAYREAAKFPETKEQAQEWLRRSGK